MKKKHTIETLKIRHQSVVKPALQFLPPGNFFGYLAWISQVDIPVLVPNFGKESTVSNVKLFSTA